MCGVIRPFYYLSILSLFLIPTVLYAWSPTDGLQVTGAGGNQTGPVSVLNFQGGSIVTWTDYRNTTANPNSGSDIYAQSIISTGAAIWDFNGLGICTVNGNQENVQITFDLQGGAIIVWEDNRDSTNSTDIYAQRVNSQGSSLWAPNGVPICNHTTFQWLPKVLTAGTGSAIITWVDFRNGGESDIYGQYINSNGSTLWATNGIPLCSATGDQTSPEIVSDGSGGAVVCWQDFRRGFVDSDVYAQRINSSGSTLWIFNGVGVATGAFAYEQSIASDGIGGAVIAWSDFRSYPTLADIYIQKLDGNGNAQWNSNGLAICTVTSYQFLPKIINDNVNGAIIVWQDERLGLSDINIYAQRVNSAGSTLWSVNGFPICDASGLQIYPEIMTDGGSGAFLVWEDWRNSSIDVYSQHINGSGISQWTLNGIPVCTEINDQRYPKFSKFYFAVVAPVSFTNIVWQDERNGYNNSDIYIQQVLSNGSIPVSTDVNEFIWYLY